MAKSPSGNLVPSSGYQSSDDSHKKPPSRPPPPKQPGESASEDELEQYNQSTTILSPAKFDEYKGLEEPGSQESEEYQDDDEERKGKGPPPKRPAPPPPAALRNLKKNVTVPSQRKNWDNFDDRGSGVHAATSGKFTNR